MADYSELKAAIRAAIYDNVSQAITGDKLQEILLEMVDELGKSYVKPAGGIPASDFTQALQDALAEIPEIFFATYGITTFAQVTAARAAGKVCVVPYDGGIFVLSRAVGPSTGNPIAEYFFTSVEANASKRVSLKDTDAWSYAVFYLELSQNKVSTLVGNEDSTTQYPSAKAVYDAIPNVFIATYGVTTYAEVAAAITAGKAVLAIHPQNDNRTFVLSNYQGTSHIYYFYTIYTSYCYRLMLDENNTWSNSNLQLQISNLVTSFGSTPSDSKYPSEKLVKNSLDAKQNVITPSNKLDYSLIDNVPQDATPVSQSDQQFTFRQTAGGAKPGASLAKVTEVRGNTLVWNQKVPVFTAAATTYKGLTLTPTSTGVYTISGTTDSAGNIIFQADGGKFVSGHKYFFGYYSVTAKIDGVATNQARLYLRDIDNNVTVGQLNPNSTETAVIATANSAGTIYVYLNFSANVAISGTLSPMAIDLTQEYGSGHEPTVAEFEALYREKYYAFNAGTLLNNKVATLETVGFNQWDEEWEEGSIDVNGDNAASSSRMRSKNYTAVFPSGSYCFGKLNGTGSNGKVFYYDAGKNFISASGWLSRNNQFNTPSNCYYIRFISAWGATYENDICINLSDPAKNGTYEPYKKNTLSLNIPTLTGKLNGEGSSVTICADGLKSAGSAYDYGVVENGFLTKIVRAVDTRAYASGDESLATVTTDGSTYTNYALTTPLTYILDTPIPVTYFVNDLGTEGITPTGVDANGVPNTAPLRASLQYGLTEGEMYGNLQAQSLPLAAFQAFLTALGTQMNGTWAMTENDGQYSFTFTPD